MESRIINMKQLIKIALLCLFPLMSMAQTPAYQKNPRSLRVTDNGQIYKWKDSIYYKELLADSLSLKEKLSNKQNSLATDGTGVKYPTVDAVNSGLSLKQSNLSIINVKDYGAVGDGITDDTDAIADAIDAGNIIYFPKTANHYRCTITLRKSNMTFIIPEGVVLDGGVFHIEGIGPGTSDWNPGDPIQYRENIRVIGKLSLTSRLGTYYAKNLFFDDVEIVADSSIYINQTAEGGSRGVHFYWGTENVFVNRMITRSTKAGESYGGLFIDANPAYVTESKPRNFYINELSIPESKFNGIWLYEVENLYFGNVNINSPLYLGIYADEVDNMSINQASIYDAGESSIQYQNSNNITIQNIISNNPSIFDVNNVSGTNVNIGYNQPLSFATDPFSQTGFSKLNISSYNDLKDRPIISGVLSDNLEIGSGVYGLLKIKGSVGALIDFYKGSTLLGEMGMEEVDVNTSQYKFYTRSGGSTFNGLSLVGDKVIVPTAPTNPTDVVRLTDLGTGWAQYSDNVYTSASPLVVNANTTATITNNSATSIENQLPIGVGSFYNSGTSKITPQLDGDSYLINVRFTAESSSVTGLCDVGIDIGGAMNIVSQETVSLRKGIGNSQRVNIVFDVFSGSTFLSNGGLIKLTSIDGNTSIYDISYKITRTHKAK